MASIQATDSPLGRSPAHAARNATIPVDNVQLITADNGTERRSNDGSTR